MKDYKGYVYRGYVLTGRVAKEIPLPMLNDEIVCGLFGTRNVYERHNVKGDTFKKIHNITGISVDRLVFDWFIEYNG
jgi:hypothetical protein